MMTGRLLEEKAIEQAVYGGCILGGGGGGWLNDGLIRGKLAVAMGRPRLVPVEEFADEEIVVTVSSVGAPSAVERYVEPIYGVRALEKLQKWVGKELKGVMTNENGASGTVNGWLQGVIIDLPVVDAAGDGRAHPTAIMGSMGLFDLPGYVSYQAAIGGDPQKGRYLELMTQGNFSRAAAMVRQASIEAGGSVAVARDPIPAAYVKSNAAIGAISHAIQLGEIYLRHLQLSPVAGIEAVAEFLQGYFLGVGVVEKVFIKQKGGFDVGSLVIQSKQAKWELCFWNEYMSLDAEGERLATFPDLVMTFSAQDGAPLVSAQVQEGMEILILVAPSQSLLLGGAMKKPVVYEIIENVTGKEIIRYLPDFTG
jgi:DUF917 family protein